MLLMLILAFPALATLKLMGLHKNRNTKKWGTTGSIYKSVQSSPEGGIYAQHNDHSTCVHRFWII